MFIRTHIYCLCDAGFLREKNSVPACLVLRNIRNRRLASIIPISPCGFSPSLKLASTLDDGLPMEGTPGKESGSMPPAV